VRAAVCGRALSCRSTTPDVNIPLLLFSMALRSFFRVSQYVSDVIVVPGSINSINSTPFLSQNTVAISFLFANDCLNFLGLFGECVCIHCRDCSLVSTLTNLMQFFVFCEHQ